jgi:hypothetical protein
VDRRPDTGGSRYGSRDLHRKAVGLTSLHHESEFPPPVKLRRTRRSLGVGGPGPDRAAMPSTTAGREVRDLARVPQASRAVRRHVSAAFTRIRAAETSTQEPLGIRPRRSIRHTWGGMTGADMGADVLQRGVSDHIRGRGLGRPRGHFRWSLTPRDSLLATASAVAPPGGRHGAPPEDGALGARRCLIRRARLLQRFAVQGEHLARGPCSPRSSPSDALR